MSIPNHNTMIIITFKKFMAYPKYCQKLKRYLRKKRFVEFERMEK